MNSVKLRKKYEQITRLTKYQQDENGYCYAERLTEYDQSAVRTFFGLIWTLIGVLCVEAIRPIYEISQLFIVEQISQSTFVIFVKIIAYILQYLIQLAIYVFLYLQVRTLFKDLWGRSSSQAFYEFTIGKTIQSNPQVIKQLIDTGHEQMDFIKDHETVKMVTRLFQTHELNPVKRYFHDIFKSHKKALLEKLEDRSSSTNNMLNRLVRIGIIGTLVGLALAFAQIYFALEVANSFQIKNFDNSVFADTVKGALGGNVFAVLTSIIAHLMSLTVEIFVVSPLHKRELEQIDHLEKIYYDIFLSDKLYDGDRKQYYVFAKRDRTKIQILNKELEKTYDLLTQIQTQASKSINEVKSDIQVHAASAEGVFESISKYLEFLSGKKSTTVEPT